MEEKFEMVAKTMMGLEQVLAKELQDLGAEDVEPGRRMVSFSGTLATLYKANLCCRTALRILKPFHKFTATGADSLYEQAKEFDWSSVLSLDQTFCIDAVVNSSEFTHSQFVTYKIKDAIVDWFRDRYGADKRPGVRLKDADIMINVHIAEDRVTLSLDSSGESLHKRGYKVAQTEAPINEVLAAGIILLSGWKGDTTFVDPMCGSGTFLIEAALIAANINPGIYRSEFSFEHWPDFDAELFDSIYNDDSGERDVTCRIIGADLSPRAVAITRENLKSAGVAKYVEVMEKSISQWTEAPQPEGVLVTNPPYGERISAPDMEALYAMIGNRLKNVFVGYHAWIIGYHEEYFHDIGLSPSQKINLLNGSLECQLREYVIFEGDKRSFLASGGRLREDNEEDDRDFVPRKKFDRDRKNHRLDGDDRHRRRFDDDDRAPRRDRRDDRRDRHYEEETEPENPLARKRNPKLIKAIMDRAEGREPEADSKPAHKFDRKPGGDRKFGRKSGGDHEFDRKPGGDHKFDRKPGGDRKFGRKPGGDRKFDRKSDGDRKFRDEAPKRGWRKK